jgi:hypothetical protein
MESNELACWLSAEQIEMWKQMSKKPIIRMKDRIEIAPWVKLFKYSTCIAGFPRTEDNNG